MGYTQYTFTIICQTLTCFINVPLSILTCFSRNIDFKPKTAHRYSKIETLENIHNQNMVLMETHTLPTSSFFCAETNSFLILFNWNLGNRELVYLIHKTNFSCLSIEKTL